MAEDLISSSLRLKGSLLRGDRRDDLLVNADLINLLKRRVKEGNFLWINPLLTDLRVVVVAQVEEVDVVVVDVEWAEETALTPVASVNLTGIVEVIDLA